jgi:hypothetical protein
MPDIGKDGGDGIGDFAGDDGAAAKGGQPVGEQRFWKRN